MASSALSRPKADAMGEARDNRAELVEEMT